MKYAFETIVVGIGAFLALLGVAFAKDAEFEAHMWVLFFVLLVSTVLLLRRIKFSQVASETADDKSGYFDEVVRYGIIATTFWGIVGFLVGVIVAFQLAIRISISNPGSTSVARVRCTPPRWSSPLAATH